jgi:hypothetical protein
VAWRAPQDDHGAGNFETSQRRKKTLACVTQDSLLSQPVAAHRWRPAGGRVMGFSEATMMQHRVDAIAQRRTEAVPVALQLRTLSFDFDARVARRGDEPVTLTAMEWSLLACLARRHGQICSRDEIDQSLGSALGRERRASNSVEVLVNRLRRKLGAKLIATHRGLGYRLQR